MLPNPIMLLTPPYTFILNFQAVISILPLHEFILRHDTQHVCVQLHLIAVLRFLSQFIEAPAQKLGLQRAVPLLCGEDRHIFINSYYSAPKLTFKCSMLLSVPMYQLLVIARVSIV